jgi:hypothetical protein
MDTVVRKFRGRDVTTCTAKLGERIECPYCGAPGVLLNKYASGGVHVGHEWARVLLRGVVPAVAYLRGCTRTGPAGSLEHEPDTVVLECLAAP